MFEAPQNPYWYLSTSGGDIYQLKTSDLSQVDVSTFAAASRIVQRDSEGKFYHTHTSPLLLKKYEYDGTLLWSFTPPAANGDSAHRFAVDSSFNVYVAGRVSLGGSSTLSLRVIKLDSSGNTVWTFDKTPPELGPANTITVLNPHGVCVDLQKNVHITGERDVLNTPALTDRFRGMFEVHLDPDGNEIWSDLSTGTGGATTVTENYGLQCVCDESGNVICRYGFRGNNPGDGIVLKGYSSAGAVQFTHLRPSVGTGTDTEFPDTEMIQYLDGELYCCGPINQIYDTSETFFRKFNGSDYTNEVWSDDPTTGAGKNVPRFALDRSGNVYGTYADTGPNRAVIRKLNGSNGSLMASSSLLNEVPFFPMVPPGNPIQFFR